MASARAMSFVSPDSSKKKLDFTIGQIDTALIIASAKGREGEKVPLPGMNGFGSVLDTVFGDHEDGLSLGQVG